MAREPPWSGQAAHYTAWAGAWPWTPPAHMTTPPMMGGVEMRHHEAYQT